MTLSMPLTHPILNLSPNTWPNSTDTGQEETPSKKTWDNKKTCPSITNYRTRLHRILASTNKWIRPEIKIEHIDNLADTPWFTINIDIEIDSGTKNQAATEDRIDTQGNRYNRKILAFYFDGSLLSGKGGTGGICIRSGCSIVQAGYYLVVTIEVFDASLYRTIRAPEHAL